MFQVMYPSIAQMKSAQHGLGVRGSNLSLINVTAGYGQYANYVDTAGQFVKAAQAPTATVGGTNPITLGIGSALGSVETDTRAGTLNPTGNKDDLGIDGNGYLMYSSGSGILYSRDGAIKKDANGDLVHTSTGYRLLGWQANNVGVVDTTAAVSFDSYINVPVGEGAAQRTEHAIVKGNLSNLPTGPATVSSKFEVYDGLGSRRVIQVTGSARTTTVGGAPGNITVAQGGAGAVAKWTWAAVQVNDDGTSTNLTTSANPSLFFNTNGDMLTDAGNAMASTGTITVPAANGAAAFTFEVDFSNIKQVALPSKIDLQTQDGYPAGALESFQIGSDGTVTGKFGRGGFTRKLGQIALSTFANPGGLDRLGNNMWGASNNSGTAVVGVANANDKGMIKTGFLERSNIDMGEQFVGLIVDQRAIQANMKIITVVDEVSGDLIHMKRS